MSEEEIRHLLELRKWIEKRLSRLKREVEVLEAALEEIKRRIGEKTLESIQPASELVKREQREHEDRYGAKLEEVQIRSRGGEYLGHAVVYERAIVIEFAEPVDEGDPAFKGFLIRKILQKWVEEDEELVSSGELDKSQAISYELRRGEGGVMGLVVRNYRTEERRRELIRAVRWTLERVLARRREES